MMAERIVFSKMIILDDLGEMHRNEMIATLEDAPARFRSLLLVCGGVRFLMIGYVGLV